MTSEFLAAMRAALDAILALEPDTPARLAAEDDMAQLMRLNVHREHTEHVDRLLRDWDPKMLAAGDTGE